jgi:hypothetical protein
VENYDDVNDIIEFIEPDYVYADATTVITRQKRGNVVLTVYVNQEGKQRLSAQPF